MAARPQIMMFGDWGVLTDRIDEQEARYGEWTQKVLYHRKSQNAKVVAVEIGAGVAVPTVRYTARSFCTHMECPLIRINPENHTLSHKEKGISIPMGALSSLLALDVLREMIREETPS